MNTDKRLDQAYAQSKVIEFDDQSKYIIFGDIHRGDNSMSDEFAHNQNIYHFALKKYLDEGYTYVEAGDGDELWEHAKFSLIRSAHSDVFCTLKEFYNKGHLILLFGNHNMILKNPVHAKRFLEEFYDEYYDETSTLFPGIDIQEGVVLKYKGNQQEFLVVHGHQGDMMNDQFWRVSMFSLRYFWRFMHIVGFQNPSSPAKNRLKRHKIEINFSKWIEKNRKHIICGHTHRPKFPKGNGPSYFNTGCGIHPRGITGIEIANGEIMLIDWRIVPNQEGELKITKQVIRGPKKLMDFEV